MNFRLVIATASLILNIALLACLRQYDLAIDQWVTFQKDVEIMLDNMEEERLILNQENKSLARNIDTLEGRLYAAREQSDRQYDWGFVDGWLSRYYVSCLYYFGRSGFCNGQTRSLFLNKAHEIMLEEGGFGIDLDYIKGRLDYKNG